MVISIMIIPLDTKVLLRVNKSKVDIYDLEWLRHYAEKKICIHTFCFILVFIHTQVLN
jgi:hypothetical protein